MLDSQTRQLVKQTAPVLKEHGVALTRHFYQRLFAHNPELRQIFNQGHQQAGTQQQALAMAVAAYAEHIDNPGVLASALTHIASKHVSLGIRAEHYPIVGQHLLASIREVLGEAASDALIDAWAAAYGQLADMLIAQEGQMYTQAATQRGGWSGWRGFKIQRKVPESEEITSFHLVPADGGPLPSYKPGQYVTVRVLVPELGHVQPRQYSLSSAPGGHALRISVKREASQGALAPAGLVSNTLHDAVAEGSVIDLSPPIGVFHLHEDRDTPVVMLSAGVGITPMVAMLDHLLQQGSARQIRFVHACRHGGVHAFREHLVNLCAEHATLRGAVFYEHPRETGEDARTGWQAGRMDLRKLADTVDTVVLPGADYYLCGPVPFMQGQAAVLRELGVSPDRIHVEAFGSGSVAL